MWNHTAGALPQDRRYVSPGLIHQDEIRPVASSVLKCHGRREAGNHVDMKQTKVPVSLKWKSLKSRVVISDRWIHLQADRCLMPSGKILDPYYVIREPDWVHVVAFRDDRRVLLVRQYRYAAGVTCWELPGGAVHKGERHLSAAKRELLEETGGRSVRWTKLGRFYANPARQDNSVHGYLAERVKITSAPALDATEEIESRFFTVEEVRRLIFHGKFSNVMHVALLFLAFNARGL